MEESTKIGMSPAKHSGKKHRRMRNLLLMPAFQIRMGVYAIALGGGFAAGATYLFYKKFEKTYRVILELTDAKDEVSQIIARDFHAVAWQLGALLLLYVLANVAISVTVTHRMVGPTYAFRRHIRHLMRGNLTSRVRLREKDAFREVANDLNELAKVMGQSAAGEERMVGARD